MNPHHGSRLRFVPAPAVGHNPKPGHVATFADGKPPPSRHPRPSTPGWRRCCGGCGWLPHMRRVAPEVLATAKAQRWDAAEVLRALLAADRLVPGIPGAGAARQRRDPQQPPAAIHSLFGYLALRHPERAGSIQRVLAVPPKRAERNLVTYVSDAEASALLGACDLTRWTGRRDHAMFALAIQTGLRISELASLTRGGVTLTAGACARTVGKGRKVRATPPIPAPSPS
jgi:integrase